MRVDLAQSETGETRQMTTIYSRIAKVSGVLVGKLGADKRNTQQNYDYISADMVLQEAGRAMSENGLVVIPTIAVECTETVAYVDNYGKPKTRFDSVVEFDMIVADDSDTIKAHWLGRGTDYSSPDKAVYKAMTSGHKYFLMKLFCIGIGNEDGEHDEPKSESRQAEPEPEPQRQTEPTTQKQTSSIGDEQRKPTEPMLKKLYASGKALYGDSWETKRKELVLAVTKKRTDSSKLLTFAECKTLIDGIEANANMLPKEPQGDQDNTMYDGSGADGAWNSMH